MPRRTLFGDMPSGAAGGAAIGDLALRRYQIDTQAALAQRRLAEGEAKLRELREEARQKREHALRLLKAKQEIEREQAKAERETRRKVSRAGTQVPDIPIEPGPVPAPSPATATPALPTTWPGRSAPVLDIAGAQEAQLARRGPLAPGEPTFEENLGFQRDLQGEPQRGPYRPGMFAGVQAAPTPSPMPPPAPMGMPGGPIEGAMPAETPYATPEYRTMEAERGAALSEQEAANAAVQAAIERLKIARARYEELGTDSALAELKAAEEALRQAQLEARRAPGQAGAKVTKAEATWQAKAEETQATWQAKAKEAHARARLLDALNELRRAGTPEEYDRILASLGPEVLQDASFRATAEAIRTGLERTGAAGQEALQEKAQDYILAEGDPGSMVKRYLEVVRHGVDGQRLTAKAAASLGSMVTATGRELRTIVREHERAQEAAQKVADARAVGEWRTGVAREFRKFAGSYAAQVAGFDDPQQQVNYRMETEDALEDIFLARYAAASEHGEPQLVEEMQDTVSREYSVALKRLGSPPKVRQQLSDVGRQIWQDAVDEVGGDDTKREAVVRILAVVRAHYRAGNLRAEDYWEIRRQYTATLLEAVSRQATISEKLARGFGIDEIGLEEEGD